MAVIRHEEPLIERCVRCGFVETDEEVCACLHETGKREVHEYVRADLHRGAVDLIRELHGILAPPDVDDPSAVPLAVDKIEAWLTANGGQSEDEELDRIYEQVNEEAQ